MRDVMGASSDDDQATAVEARSASPIRDGIPSALSDLVGEGVFEIVPKTDIRHPLDPDASGVIFTLNRRTFIVFENPEDGYRSSASPLLSFAGSAYEICVGNFTFSIYINERVVCRHRTAGSYGNQDDVLEVYSKETDELIFEVGTEDIDDYYPGYVCRWHPESLSVNGKARIRLNPIPEDHHD